MYKKILFTAIAASLFSGCASVPMASKEKSDEAKKFAPPAEGHAGLYIYRASGAGTALKKDVWVNDECIGETAPNMFFYQQVKGGTQHKVSTESEFSPNDLIVNTKKGENYFLKQYIKMGVFVVGAKLKLMDQTKGKKEISKLEMAIKGSCS